MQSMIRARNVRIAIDAADAILTLGYVPFVPHLTHFWHMVHPRHYEQWMDYDYGVEAFAKWTVEAGERPFVQTFAERVADEVHVAEVAS